MSTDQTLASINFTGGFPTNQDFVPSIVFLIYYVVLAPLFVYRIIRKQDRTMILLRPGLFLVARFAMLVLRAIMAKNNYSEDELIAELVFVSLGYLFLLEPLVALWKKHVESAVAGRAQPVWVGRFALLLQVGVFVSIITAIYSSAEISSAINDSSKLTTVKDVRKASYVISMIVAMVTLLGLVICHVRFGLAAKGSAYLFVLAAFLNVIGVYRVIQTFTTDPNAVVRKDVIFWILQMAFEALAFLMIISISLPTWFPGDADYEAEQKREKANKQYRAEQGYNKAQQYQKQKQLVQYQAHFPPSNIYQPNYQHNTQQYPKYPQQAYYGQSNNASQQR